MNSYITCANQFHPKRTIPEIIAFRDSRSCLTDCGDGDPPPPPPPDREQERRLGRGPAHVPRDFSPKRNKTLDVMIDREVQRTETFTGIEGINTQDQAIQESMGPILDRTKENLAASDMAIVIARRMLLEAAGSVADGGDPPGVGDSYYNVRAIDAIVPNDSDWKEELEARMYGH